MNSVDRHMNQSVEKLWTAFLMLTEVPILEDNPADCFI